MRRIVYVTGTRADFGLIERTLKLAQSSGKLDVFVLVTGMHLLHEYGYTVSEIEASGIPILDRIPVELDGSSGSQMAKAIGNQIVGMTEIFVRHRPDVVMVLGDRGEMLAGALAAIHLNIPVVHIHGGERSGTVDEPVRHAISKLAHYHFVATECSRERLIRMGERPERIFVTGAPGLDGLKECVKRTREELCVEVGFDPHKSIALVLFHPVLQEETVAGTQIEEIMRAALDVGLQTICFMPNADAGGRFVRDTLMRFEGHLNVRVVTHLPRTDFVSWMAAADVMVGNSSAGIIEAASLGLRVVNVGDRQRQRERSGNVIDVVPERRALSSGIRLALKQGRYTGPNVYGDGEASRRIADLLALIEIDATVLYKTNGY